MSDTPKTDELISIYIAKRDFVPDGLWIRHSRELERENAALREQVEHLIGMIEQLESDLAHFATIEAFDGKKEAQP